MNGPAPTDGREARAALRTWLFSEALPLWWRVGADHVHGGFHEAIGLDGAPVLKVRRARVQARQVYVYATAGAMGWDGPWRDAVAHGLDYFLTRYRRADGFFRTAVDPDGSPADETVTLYDQAFALLALAAAQGADPARAEPEEAARALLALIQAHLRWPAGGYREPGGWEHQSNAHMHLLEAALAWSELSDEAGWPAVADEIVELCLTRFVDAGTGALREFFDGDWRPAPGVEGRIVEPGHQFEWAWLLARWSGLRGRPDVRAVAERLYRIGSGPGVDRARGVATNQLLDDLSPHDPSARLWPQTEWIKAASALAGPQALAPPLAALRLYLDTPTPGLWRDRMRVDGAVVQEPAPASSFYHIVCALAEVDAGRQA